MLDGDIVHPKRLLIMTVLFLMRELTEGEIARATGLGWGSLSTHLARLEARGLVERRKKITRKGIRTVVKITEKGYRAYVEEVEKLRRLIDSVSERYDR